MHGEIHDMTDRSEDGSMCKRMCSVEMAICSAISLALMMLSAFALYLLAYVVVPLGLEDGFVIGVCLTAASFCWMITSILIFSQRSRLHLALSLFGFLFFFLSIGIGVVAR
jgi:hypothetical protein